MDYEPFERLLYMLEGARTMAAHELLQDGEMKDAMQRLGEVRGYRLVRSLLDEYRETGALPAFTEGEHWQEYEAVARRMEAADAAIDGADGPDEPSPGVQ